MRGAMVGFIHISVTVLSLLSVGQSLPVTSCDILTKPVEIQGREQLLGKWTIVGEATTIPGSKILTKMFVKNAWIRLTAAPDSDAIDVYQAQNMLGRCFMLRAQMILENNTSTSMMREISFNSSSKLLNTGCPDCHVYFSQFKMGDNTYSGLQLTSRRTKVSAAELEEFQKQVECLNLPPPAILNQDQDFCPEDSPVTVDLTRDVSEIGPKALSLLDKIINDDGFLNTVINAAFSILKGEEEN